MRRAILTEKIPSYAVNTYNRIKGATPKHKPSGINSAPWPQNYNMGRLATHENMKACFSYMIEPTRAKAEQMYDLIYNADVLTSNDKTNIDDFFSDISRVLAFSREQWPSKIVRINGEIENNIDEEGSYRESYENWWQLAFHAGVVFALVSHDQSAVDRVFKTDIPEDYFLRTMDQYSGTRDLKNMINGLVYLGPVNTN